VPMPRSVSANKKTQWLQKSLLIPYQQELQQKTRNDLDMAMARQLQQQHQQKQQKATQRQT